VASVGECAADVGAVELGNVTACETGPSADPDKSCGSGQFCELDTGVCNAKNTVFDGVCTAIPEACTLEYMPVRTYNIRGRMWVDNPLVRTHAFCIFSLPFCRSVAAMVRPMGMRVRHKEQVLVFHAKGSVPRAQLTAKYLPQRLHA
jgi:hypothetical protein